jgi:hypothetical protein
MHQIIYKSIMMINDHSICVSHEHWGALDPIWLLHCIHIGILNDQPEFGSRAFLRYAFMEVSFFVLYYCFVLLAAEFGSRLL